MIHGEAPFVGVFLDDFRQRLARTMTGFGFDTDQFGRVAGVGSLQSGGVFERVSGHYAVVVVGSSNKYRGIFY